jgi:hypothetical protein
MNLVFFFLIVDVCFLKSSEIELLLREISV